VLLDHSKKKVLFLCYHNSATSQMAEGLPRAIKALDNFSFRYGANVRVKDFMAFSNNYYADLVDAVSGLGLAEVLVDRYTRNTY
jgi:hypothetical protein